MSRRVIRNTPTKNSASGVWSLRDVIQHRTGNLWPEIKTFELTTSSATAVENGSPITITLTTANVPDGTVIPYTITGISQDDLDSGNINGNFTITDNSGSVSLSFIDDLAEEVLETATVSLPTIPMQPSKSFTVLDPPKGQQAYTTPGTYSWVAPDGVTSVCVVCVGAGGSGGFQWSSGGGGGGGLGYKNNISVTPGQSYTVVVGDKGSSVSNARDNLGAAGTSYFINTSTVAGWGAGRGGTGSSSSGWGAYGGGYTGDGGGAGGNGAVSGSWTHGGGGAGGYSGNGASRYNDTNAQGGGGGAGQYYSSTYGVGAGGGVGILGEGANGSTYANGTGYGGRGGSGGGDGMAGESGTTTSTNVWERSASVTTSGSNQILGGQYGGGGGGSGTTRGGGFGGTGAVRIIWGVGRSFPSTNTGDV
jgi:hypothetical protein